MKRGSTGYLVRVQSVGEQVRAFVPHQLPPEPQLSLSEPMQNLLGRANLALGRLDGLARVLPDPSLFLYSYVRKEAVLSSQIEGTQSSLSDLMLFESDAAPGVPLDDVREVSNYVAAMEKGIAMLREGYPICLRLIREIHAVLLAHGRGSEREPGEFRRSQNWIGGTRPGNAAFVPPPADMILECMGALERYLNSSSETPVLIKAALAHVQFETIHPFLDGNGRVGRLLVALMLCAEKALQEPSLYLSLYLKQNRQKYYELLQLVRTAGDWESWLQFFLLGVEATATEAASAAAQLLATAHADAKRIETIGKSAGTALRLHKLLQARPVISVAQAAEQLNLSFSAVNNSFRSLENLALVANIANRARNRSFAYLPFLEILNKGTETKVQ